MGKDKRYAPSNIQEVRRVATVKCKNIHSCHSKTCTIHQTTDVAVELDEVKVCFLSLYFRRLLLGDITEGKDIFLPEFGIVVETKLGIHATQTDTQFRKKGETD
jgi:hypothetical protein